MGAGNVATFTGTVNGEGPVTWSTAFSASDRRTPPPSALTSDFQTGSSKDTAATNLAAAFTAAPPPKGYSASASDNVVTISCKSGFEVASFTVDGTQLQKNKGEGIGTTGLTVTEST